jgi:DNA repair protein RadC
VKPGRKLVEQGAAACTDAELLAILIGSGGRGYSALDAANALLAKYGTFTGLMDKSLYELAEARGIKAARAIRIAAAYEMCSRIIKELEHGR